ncbi:hypothetical protein D1816_23030 [Aquimarina sp. AD10]|uniref:NACHT domain-containing protein n=1 Tax=Aquimarina sp. AD10 TaxID=1714849 RepID=UPI000E50EC9D|nr:hypothetical protein [Aquimarina sp. AD10]AXT63098.1 hypothetical protein D1816_23030 [Aquimarina sp. AD10]RKM98686.1 hypothetical protein D7033_12175 [Aquimarina sp. AD10]
MIGKVKEFFHRKGIYISRRGIYIKGLYNSNVIIIEKLIFTSQMDLAKDLSKSRITKKQIKSVDRKKFIGNSKIDSRYIDRTFYYNNDQSDTSFDYSFHEREDEVKLKDEIIKRDKVLILGNPGLGKTTELERLAAMLWNEDELLIPIYKNLKNFTAQDTLEAYIGLNWALLDNVIFIFDGIDEISDIHDFISKLESFITNLQGYDIKHRFIVSCRTNVYEDIVKRIVGFHKLFLREFRFEEGFELLQESCKNNLDKNSVKSFISNFLKNPLQIEIIASFINVKGKIPTNTAEIWKEYIDKRLARDAGFKLIRRKLNIPLIKTHSKSISLINELMRRNTFSDDDIYTILNNNTNDFKEFKKNPLMDKYINSDLWYFEHKNVQEYFAASKLSMRNFNFIIDFIQIEKTGKTHPLLFNTITFLINLLPKNSKKCSDLVNWLTENEPELLFRADYDRINDDTRVMVFQAYFRKECIDKTLWIDSRRKFELDRIARFADTTENFQYLYEIAQDTEYHFRVRYSALMLLPDFRIPMDRRNEIREYIINQLNLVDLEIAIKCQIMSYVKAKSFYLNNRDLINEIFDIFEGEANKQINSSLISLIENRDDIDEFAEYIYEEFKRVHHLVPRNDNDDVMRGNKYKVEKLIFRFDSADNFLLVVSHYFNNDIGYRSINDQVGKISERCIYFINQDQQFLITLLDEINDVLRFHTHRDLLFHIINSTQTNDMVIRHLVTNYEVNEVLILIARILEENSLDFVISEFIKKGINKEEIEGFRNRIANTNTDRLALLFEKKMAKNGINFSEVLFTSEQREQQQDFFLDTVQENLNVIFDTKELLERIQAVFLENEDSINWEVFLEIEHEWYEENGFGSVMVDTPLSFIREFLPSGNNALNFDMIRENLEEDFVRFYELKRFIQNCKSHNWEFQLSNEQKKSVEKWSFGEVEDFDFDDVITVFNGGRSYTSNNNNSLKIETIFFFQDLLGFDLSIEFLLGCIEFDLFINEDGDKTLIEHYDYLKSKINSDELFNERIIFNLNNRELFSWSFTKHVGYALDYQLVDVYPIIRTYFLNDNLSSHESEKLEKFVQLTDDIALLIERCEDINSQSHWSAINILMDLNKEQDFCVDRSIEYLGLEGEIHNTNALQVLFLSNRIEAIRYIIDVMDRDEEILSIRSFNFENYNIIEDYNMIRQLFEIIHQTDFDDFERSSYKAFLSEYLINIVRKGDIEYNRVMQILNGIKDRLIAEDNDLFHVNMLIDEVNYNYYFSKSDPYEFEEAFSCISELL